MTDNSETNKLIPPPFFLAAVLLFWANQTGLWLFAIPMAVLVEVPRYTDLRWSFSDQEISRITDLTTVVWIIAGIYLFSQSSAKGLFILLSWSPILFFCLLAAQLYRHQGALPLSSLMLSLRGKKQNVMLQRLQRKKLDLRYPYTLLCLLASSVNNDDYFFYGIVILTAWALSAVRSRRYSWRVWFSVLGLCVCLGYAGQWSLRQMQLELEALAIQWLDSLWQERDPYQNQTALGSIGQLKLSNKVVMRVQANQPLLLREASYDSYNHQTWRSRRVHFSIMPTNSQSGLWQLHANRQNLPTDRVNIERNLIEGKATLALPAGTIKVQAPSGVEIQQNRYDHAVTLINGPTLLSYQADFLIGAEIDKLPSKREHLLDLPRVEKAYIQQLATQLGLLSPTLSYDQKRQRIAQFFEQDFKYSLDLSETPAKFTALRYFLQESQRGHCEYFASATVLLLRAAGIPSRYAVGYSVQEYSPLEQSYVVRKRHAHAWALSYHQGQWQVLDTTPADWYEQESANMPWWLNVYDLFSWLHHQYQRWRWLSAQQQQESGWSWQMTVLLSLLLLWLCWHLQQRQRSRKMLPQAEISYYDSGSPFTPVMQQLSTAYHAPTPYQTLHKWLAEIHQQATWSAKQHQNLHDLLRWHQRYRFDPHGLESDQYQFFKQQVESYLQHYGVDIQKI